jgi:hypothetical protein
MAAADEFGQVSAVLMETGTTRCGHSPICPSCGVAALPAETSNVIYSAFVCENPDSSIVPE